MYTGNIKIYRELFSQLLAAGFKINRSDSIHIGDDKYEFYDCFLDMGLGCHNIHTILAWKEEGKLKYKALVTGFCCVD